jgi:HD superfamily phosphodiesterase
MKTASGRALAEERHAYMLGFLAQFEAEWRGEK